MPYTGRDCGYPRDAVNRDEAKAPLSLQARVTEVQSELRRVLSEVQAENESLKKSIGSFNEAAIQRILAPYVEQLRKIDTVLALQEDTLAYRRKREEEDRINAIIKEREEHARAIGEAKHRRIVIWVKILGPILLALIGLFTGTAISQSAHSTPSSESHH